MKTLKYVAFGRHYRAKANRPRPAANAGEPAYTAARATARHDDPAALLPLRTP